MGDGNYPPYTCDDKENCSEYIYIIKAVEANHGTSIGWNTSFGDGQAVFYASAFVDPETNKTKSKAALTFYTSYYDINGQVGEKKSNHGFRFSATDKLVNFVILLYDDINSTFTNIKIRHCEINHYGCDKTNSGAGIGFKVHSTVSLYNSLLQYCYFHDFPGIPIYFCGNSENNIVEYCYVARNHSDSADKHGEGIQCTEGCNNITVRYSIWEDIEGTAFIVTKNSWSIYGNIFFYTPNYPHPGQSGEGIGMGIVTGHYNNKVYNNTVYGVAGPNATYYFTNTGNVVYNNIWVNCEQGSFFGATSDYNAIYNFLKGYNGHTEPHFQIFSEDPFINSTNYNFYLKSETDAGYTLSSPYNKDYDGLMRGNDGIWTRGAYEK